MGKKIVVIVISVLLLLLGAGFAAAGGALMALFGSDNTATSGQQHLSTQTAALVATADDINGTNGFATTVTVRSILYDNGCASVTVRQNGLVPVDATVNLTTTYPPPLSFR